MYNNDVVKRYSNECHPLLYLMMMMMSFICSCRNCHEVVRSRVTNCFCSEKKASCCLIMVSRAQVPGRRVVEAHADPHRHRNNKYPTAICPFGYPQHELHKPVLPPCGHRYRTYLLYNEPSLRPFMIATPKAAH